LGLLWRRPFPGSRECCRHRADRVQWGCLGERHARRRKTHARQRRWSTTCSCWHCRGLPFRQGRWCWKYSTRTQQMRPCWNGSWGWAGKVRFYIERIEKLVLGGSSTGLVPRWNRGWIDVWGWWCCRAVGWCPRRCGNRSLPFARVLPGHPRFCAIFVLHLHVALLQDPRHLCGAPFSILQHFQLVDVAERTGLVGFLRRCEASTTPVWRSSRGCRYCSRRRAVPSHPSDAAAMAAVFMSCSNVTNGAIFDELKSGFEVLLTPSHDLFDVVHRDTHLVEDIIEADEVVR